MNSMEGDPKSHSCPPARIYLTAPAAAACCMAGFYWRERALGVARDHVPDGRLDGYRPADVEAFFHEIVAGPWGANGVSVYAATQLTIDFVFPLAYAAILGCALVALYGRQFGRWLVLLPAAVAVTDWTENLTLAGLALSAHATAFTPDEQSWAEFASKATVLKWQLAAAAVGLVILGAPVWVGRKIVARGRSKRANAAK